MKLEFIPKVVYSLELLLATLVIFYIIGLIAKKIIQKVLEGNMFVKNTDTALQDIELPEQDIPVMGADANGEGESASGVASE